MCIRDSSLINTEPEISAGSEDCIQINNNYIKNTTMIPTNKLRIRTANKNKTLATEQVKIKLKYDELKVNSPAVIIIKLMWIVVLGIDILTKCKA